VSNIRILLVDDHEIVREGLRALLSRREGFHIVAQAGTVAESIVEAERTRPDIVVMDVRLPDGSGIEACREIREAMPETKVIILTSYADDDAVFASILAGASGYVLKQTRGRALADAIDAVARGESLLDPGITQKVMERLRTSTERRAADPIDALNEQEHKILALIAEGKTNKEIAAEVFLSDKTVKNYVSSILTKLNLRRRSEAAAFIARREPNSGQG
jgi:DNA-binding NarL/FixJ family response regulator